MISSLSSPAEGLSLSSLLAPPLAAVEACVKEKMKASVLLIPEVAGYLISLGGKRLRPLLTLAAAELCGYKGDRHIYLAACVELIHTATLLHDDVVDESKVRRGKITANTKWNNKISVLVGDFLFSRAFEIMIAEGGLEGLAILSKASSIIVEGEVMQLTASYDLEITQDTYLKIIQAKTARLFSAAMEVGAVVAEAPSAVRRSLACFGEKIGLAFQVMDDVLDYAADSKKLGKRIGDDFRTGKVTLPVIFAYEENRPFWQEVFENGLRDEEALTRAIDVLKASGALSKTKQLAAGFVAEALECLEDFPPTPLKEALQEMAWFCVERER